MNPKLLSELDTLNKNSIFCKETNNIIIKK